MRTAQESETAVSSRQMPFDISFADFIKLPEQLVVVAAFRAARRVHELCSDGHRVDVPVCSPAQSSAAQAGLDFSERVLRGLEVPDAAIPYCELAYRSAAQAAARNRHTPDESLHRHVTGGRAIYLALDSIADSQTDPSGARFQAFLALEAAFELGEPRLNEEIRHDLGLIRCHPHLCGLDDQDLDCFGPLWQSDPEE